MRRKYNDLLAKRAGMLAEAETLLKDGKREDYKSKMSEIGNINDEITEVRPSSTSRTASSWNARTIPARRRTRLLSAAIP